MFLFVTFLYVIHTVGSNLKGIGFVFFPQKTVLLSNIKKTIRILRNVSPAMHSTLDLLTNISTHAVPKSYATGVLIILKFNQRDEFSNLHFFFYCHSSFNAIVISKTIFLPLKC